MHMHYAINALAVCIDCLAADLMILKGLMRLECNMVHSQLLGTKPTALPIHAWAVSKYCVREAFACQYHGVKVVTWRKSQETLR